MRLYHLFIICLLFISCEDSQNEDDQTSVQDIQNESNQIPIDDQDESEETPTDEIELNIRFHLMQGESWIHPLGTEMNSWITTNDVRETIIPEMNNIYIQTGISWKVENIILESYNEYSGYIEDIDFIINTERDENGHSDPERLPRLYNLMDLEFKSSDNELDGNLFHIYIFPFIGNTSQGNAMRNFGLHSVVGSWTNKHNEGGNPEKTFLIEPKDKFVRGSISRTISHELGHVLGLTHSCDNCLMDGSGYIINEEQTTTIGEEAQRRSGK